MRYAWILVGLLVAGCPAPTMALAARQDAPALPSPPPWPAPTDALPGLRAANIQDYLTSGTHIHAHLDVYFEGNPVVVPARLGMDPNAIFIAPLHTHTPSGILHLQAPAGKTYTLAQIFAVWGVKLDGALAWDQGNPVPQPAQLVMQDHHEVVVAYGTLPPRIPVDYNAWSCVDWNLCE